MKWIMLLTPEESIKRNVDYIKHYISLNNFVHVGLWEGFYTDPLRNVWKESISIALPLFSTDLTPPESKTGADIFCNNFIKITV